jgi:hypothetical protein
MNADIARDYDRLTSSQKAWFDKRVAGLDELVQREWLLYLKVEEKLSGEGLPVRFNHDMSGFYFTYSDKTTETWHTFYPFQGWEDNEGTGGVTYQCVQDADEKAHEVVRGVDVQTVDGLAGSRRRSNP